jgi:hypothetical protein
VDGGQKVTAVAASFQQSLFVTADGSVWALGGNYFGQLGLGDITDRFTPEPVTVPGGKKVTAVAAGYSHSLFLTEDGELWAMGRNNLGQLGDGTNTDSATPVKVIGFGGKKVAAVAAGYGHCLFLTEDGELWAMGYNSNGQLGVGDTTDRSTPVKVPVDGNQVVIAVAAGFNHSLILTADAGLYATGRNNFGQLGDGTTTDQNVFAPVAITIVPPPTAPTGFILTQPVSQVVTVGASVTFTVVGSDAYPFDYQWYFNDTEITGATSASYTIGAVATGHAGSYKVKVSNLRGWETSDPATLTVNDAPIVPPTETWDIAGIAAKGVKLTAPKTLVVPKGAKLDKGTKAVYVWTDADGHILNKLDKAGNPISAKTYTAKTDGIYTVTLQFSAKDAAGNVLVPPASVPLGKVKLFVAPKIAKVGGFFAEQVTTLTGVANSVVSGETLKLTVVLDAATTAPVNYFWYKNGKLWGAPTLESTALTDIRTTDAFGAKADTYHVVIETVARDAKGVKPLAKVKSKPLKPKVLLKPAVVISTAPAKLVAVSGKAITLTAKATGTAKLTYAWYKNGSATPLAGATKATLSLKNVTAADAGTYRVEVRNAAGVASATATVTVTAPI